MHVRNAANYFKDLGLSLNRLPAFIFSILAKTEINYFRRPPLSFNRTVVCSSRTCRKLWREAALTESTLIVVFDHKQRFQTCVPSNPPPLPTHSPTLPHCLTVSFQLSNILHSTSHQFLHSVLYPYSIFHNQSKHCFIQNSSFTLPQPLPFIHPATHNTPTWKTRHS